MTPTAKYHKKRNVKRSLKSADLTTVIRLLHVMKWSYTVNELMFLN